MNIRELDLTVDTLDGGTELINEDLVAMRRTSLVRTI